MAEKHEEWKKKLDEGLLPFQIADGEDLKVSDIRKALVGHYGENVIFGQIQANRKQQTLTRRAERQEKIEKDRKPAPKGPWDKRAPKEFASLLAEAKKAKKMDKLVNMHFKAIANIRAAMKSPK